MIYGSGLVNTLLSHLQDLHSDILLNQEATYRLASP